MLSRIDSDPIQQARFPYESPRTSRHGRGAGHAGVPGRCSPAEAHGEHGEALVPRAMGVPT